MGRFEKCLNKKTPSFLCHKTQWNSFKTVLRLELSWGCDHFLVPAPKNDLTKPGAQDQEMIIIPQKMKY